MLIKNIILEEIDLEGTNVNHGNILNEIKSFKKIQLEVQSKLWSLLEDTIIAGNKAKEITNDSSGFIVNISKDNFILRE